MERRIQRLTFFIAIICFTGIIYFFYFKSNFGTTTNFSSTKRLSFQFKTTTSTSFVTKIEYTENKTIKDNNDEILLKINKESLVLKRRKADERKQLMNSKDYRSFYGIIAPEAECPNLIRIGKIGDGGKWICNPFELLNLQRQCIFYSLGLNNEISFDLELMEITKNQCKHIAVDMNKQRPNIIQQLPYTNFLKGKISHKSNETFDEYALQDLMTKYNTSAIDILKMDIEGSEYSILDQLIDIEICQILVELHSPDSSFKKFYQWLNKMSKAGFYLIHFEINEGTLSACEFTLIHKSCFNKYGISVIKQFLS